MDARDRRRFCARARLLCALLLGGMVAVALRSMQLSVHQHQELARLARSQYLNDVAVPARRGQVYDRNGRPLAISVDVPSVFANPAAVPDARVAARALAPLLGTDLDTLYQRLAGDRLFVWLKRQVSPDLAAKVQALGIAGIGTTQESRRFYPNRELGAHLIGFTDVDSRGLEGIERALDDALAGEPQVVAVERDGRGHAVLASGLDPDERARGADAQLTVDLQIQHVAEEALHNGMRTSHARSALAVVLDVASAEVLAIAVAPSWNPNLASEISADRRRNRALTDVFEPGSSMKPLMIAAALDTGAVRPDATFFCENGSFTIGNRTIHDTHPLGWLSLTGIIQKSSNIGAAKVGQTLGRDRLGAALRAYGFGRRTGMRFPGEVSGLLRDPSTWSEINTSTISYGHGVAVTAVQLAAAYRVLATDGIYRAPRLIRGVEAGGTELAAVEPTSVDVRVLSPATVRRVRTMLEAAVSAEGTGRLANVPGFRVAGKTGTSTKLDPFTGTYSDNHYVAIFAGFLPLEAPRVVIVVAFDDPEGDHTGGLVAAPTFAEIGGAVMSYLGVVPTQAVVGGAEPKPADVPSIAAKEGAEPIAAEPPRPGAMPSFVGLTARQAVERFGAVGRGLELSLTGSGRVIRQEPLAGSSRAATSRLSLELGE